MKVIKRIIQIIVAISSLAGIVAFIAERYEKPSAHKPYGVYEKYIKRPLDAFLATGALIVFSPILLITAILVHVKLGNPVVFAQERPGKDEKTFRLLKFRSMTDERDESGNLLPDEARLTKFSRALRATSMDELISLVNVVKGDLSIVGPRPLLMKYLPRYNEQQHRRHDVRPGLTGLAQVNGRNLLSWEEKFRFDVEYVNHVTFWEDMKITLKTVATVFKREGISSETSATMEEFMGSEAAVR